MSVVSVIEQIASEGEWQLGDEGAYKRDYTRNFLVMTDSVTTTQSDVLAYSTLPQLGQPNPADTHSVATTITAKRDANNLLIWQVAVKYSILNRKGEQPKNPQNPNDNSDPRNWVPEISSSWVRYQVPTYMSVENDPIVNSVGDIFQPPLYLGQ